MAEFQANLRKTALLNVDLQNLFVQDSPIAAPDGLAVIQRVNRLSAACRRLGVPVVHTLHVTRPDGSNDMGGVPRAELQRATLAVLAFGFAEVLTVDEMIRKLESAR